MTKLPNRKKTNIEVYKMWDVNDLLERIRFNSERLAYRYFEQGKLKDMKYS